MTGHGRAGQTLLALVLATAAAGAREPVVVPPPVPPPEVLTEAKTLFAELVALDTSPTGGTHAAVELLAGRLRDAGFGEEDLWLVGPRRERLNLAARLRGSGKRPPILFLSHLDVVAADPTEWTVPPFVLTEKDGFYYGRGTLDIKDECVTLVSAFLRLKRAGFVPDRDLVLALTADEEGGDENGVRWLLEHRRELFDVAYVINTDAGGLQLEDGKLRRMPIQTSEKLYLTFDVATTAAGGHSSLPVRDNAIYRLAAALGRLEGLEFPLTLNDTTRLFFERLAGIDDGPLATAFRGVLADPPAPEAVAALSAIPLYNGTLRTVCSATEIAGGHAENALPQRATATLQCRLLPGDDPERVRQVLLDRIADPRVTVTPRRIPQPAPASPIEPEVFAAVEAVVASMWPGVPVVPVMDPWSTDGAWLRQAGIPVYGISGVYFDVDDVRAHGADERIAVAAFEQGVEHMARLVRRLAGGS